MPAELKTDTDNAGAYYTWKQLVDTNLTSLPSDAICTGALAKEWPRGK